jgi:hypothetical protein
MRMQFLAFVAMAFLSAGGCYRTASFVPEPGVGRPVTNGDTPGVGLSFPKGAPLGSESRIIVAVEDAYEVPNAFGDERTLVHIVADAVNEGDRPGKLYVRECYLEVNGRRYTPGTWIRFPSNEDKSVRIGADRRVRFDLFYDLGSSERAAGGPPRVIPGIPLEDLKEFALTISAELEGELRRDRLTFARKDEGSSWNVTASPRTYLYYGWWTWLQRDLDEFAYKPGGDPDALEPVPPSPGRM